MKKFLATVIIITMISPLCACTVQPVSQTRFMLDTVLTITLYDGDAETANKAFELTQELAGIFDAYDAKSELYRLNSAGEGTVSDELAYVISQSIKLSNATDGAFDIALLDVTALWHFIDGGTVPKPDELAQTLAGCGCKKIEQDGNYIRLNGVHVDLGGIAKGYICGRVRDLLISLGVKNAVLDFGGNICVIGNKNGAGYNIGVRSPFDGGLATTVKLSNSCAVTSGIYERYFDCDGIRYHHILNPKTGYPVQNGLASVTVLCNDALLADALSTACFVLGIDASRELLLQPEYTDIRLLFITQAGEQIYLP